MLALLALSLRMPVAAKQAREYMPTTHLSIWQHYEKNGLRSCIKCAQSKDFC